jgi:hypothetical protein
MVNNYEMWEQAFRSRYLKQVSLFPALARAWVVPPDLLLIYTHVTPYGTFRLDMSKRLDIDEVRASA